MNIMNKITLKSLIKNKTRTIVTIIGVILSAAMITAVTAFTSSIQQYIVNYSIAKIGDWHIMFGLNNSEAYNEIIKDRRVAEISLVKEGYYAYLTGGINQYKPYLYLMELDKKALDTLPLYLIEGRLPENGDEVLISEHVLSNGGVEYKIGDQIELKLGLRYLDGYVLNQYNPITFEDEGEKEELKITGTRKFTVVGICKRLPYELEGYSAPGYSIITRLDETNITFEENERVSVYLKLKNPRKVYDFENDISKKYNIESVIYNDDVLRYMGISNIDRFNKVLYGLASIVMVLIMVGSVSLIYNSFSISVSERRKHFGLLSSVGATRKQLINSVLYEALVIGSIGIPLGIGSGILGIGVTLYLLRDNFIRMFGERYPVELSLSVSVASVIVAALVSIITILISAYIPARRAKKISPMDAVRQTMDIKLTAKKVKTSALTRKIFGIEGDIALKNLKRNRKRYRSTVFSLFISVLLFISTSAFSMYLTKGVENVYEDYNYDISYTIYKNDVLSQNHLLAFENICNLDGIEDGSIIRNSFWNAALSKDQVEPSFYSRMLEYGYNDGDDVEINIIVYSVDHNTFVDYISVLGLNKEKFLNSDEITAVAVDKQHYFSKDEGRYINSNIFKKHDETTITVYDYSKIDYNESDTSQVDNLNGATIVIGAFADTVPIGVSEYSPVNSILLIVDDEVIKNTESSVKNLPWYNVFYMYFKADKPAEVIEDIKKILTDAGLDTTDIFNIAEQVEDNRNIITILNVFAYGFIVLMSLITIANVFNTISTNINLRRREFAMIKSVGITNSGFNKMLNYECIFYGLKALLYGIPASICVTYLIYLSMTEGVDIRFFIPVKSIFISIFSVFLVVFVSMMYSMRKIRRENILDTLKNENI